MESLYTTYRPQTFEDVAGQRAIVGALERAVVNGTVGHAYLFCGPRGTGKTTLARILAKALECDAGPGVLPDGTCEQCEAIAAGVHPDVQELDAASRNGVNDIRDEVISKVNFAPVRGRYKVYIIDEVHMLTPAAFNALLKTLEEPPEHVVFIFCTTDPQKILPTVLSRVQRYNFSPLSDDDIRQRLEVICGHEGFSVTPEAMALIVRHAHGGMRDAISTLEQLAIFGDGSVDEAMARDLLGSAAGDTLSHFVEALAARDAAALFSLVATIVSEGRDLQQFDAELLARVRDLYVVSVAGALPGVVLATEEELVELQREASLFEGPERLSRILGELDHVSYALRTAPDPRLVFEVALTKLVRPECDLTLESLAERIAMLEAGRGAAPVAAVAASRPAPEPSAPMTPAAPVAPSMGRPTSSSAPVGRSPKPEPVQARPTAPMADRPAPAAPVRPAGVDGLQPSAPAPTPTAPRADVPQSTAPVPSPAPVEAVRGSGAVQDASHPSNPNPAAAGRIQSDRPVQEAPQPSDRARTAPASAAPATVAIPPSAESWERVIGLLPASHAAFLSDSRVLSDDGSLLTVGIAGESHFTLGMLNRQDMKATIEQATARVLGPRRIEFTPDEASAIGVPPANESARATEFVHPSGFPSIPITGKAVADPSARSETVPPAPSVPPSSSTTMGKPVSPAPSAQPESVERPVAPEPPASAPQAAQTTQMPVDDGFGYEDIPPASVYDDVPPWEDLPVAPGGSSHTPSAPAPMPSDGGLSRPSTTPEVSDPSPRPSPARSSRSVEPPRDVRSPIDVATSLDANPASNAGSAETSGKGAALDVSGLDPQLTTIVETLSNAFGSVEVIGVEPSSGSAQGRPAGADTRKDG